MVFAAFAEVSRGICGVWAAYARMRGECVVFVGWGSRGICGGSRSVGTGGGWAGNAWYLRVAGLLGTSVRGVRVVFVGYGWCMDGECVVLAGRSIYSRLGLILLLPESEFRNIK